jgi:hypothetical protein
MSHILTAAAAWRTRSRWNTHCVRSCCRWVRVTLSKGSAVRWPMTPYS